jgi:hypothetical protein
MSYSNENPFKDVPERLEEQTEPPRLAQARLPLRSFRLRTKLAVWFVVLTAIAGTILTLALYVNIRG